jgi:pimeloyl-ACP methyl ester carboxylesterase
MSKQEIIKTESHIHGLKIAITHNMPTVESNDYPVLLLHGSSFPSALSFGFVMDNTAWMDNLTENGYDVYALDFLGYGNSDRYPEMQINSSKGKPLGRATEVYPDVDKAVHLILQKTGKDKLYLLGHSWGGSVAALYASKFPDKIARLVLFAAITARNDSDPLKYIESSYEILTPLKRIEAMQNLTPAGKECRLEKNIFESWGNTWLISDPLSIKFKSDSVRYPSGPSQDIEDLHHNKSYYSPAGIKAPTLIIRGEWDKYPNNTDYEILFTSLENAASKKYVVIEHGTHVMHLEKSRYQLYDEVLHFLQDGKEF